MNDNEQLLLYSGEPWSGSTHKTGNYTFFTYILVVVCGGLPAFHRFHRLLSQILVVVCGGLWWFVVVCGGLRWFVVVCGGL